jgi:hypothetical protein
MSTQQKPDSKQAADPKEEANSNTIDDNTISFRGSWRKSREVSGTVVPQG